MRVWLVFAVASVAACGARTGLYVLGDAGPPHDAGIDVHDAAVHDALEDAPQDVVVADVLVACPPGGYFIEVSTDASTSTIRGGCNLPWPASTCMPGLAEDCFSTRGIDGCDDAGALFLPSDNCICQSLKLGVLMGAARYVTASGEAFGTSTIDVTAIGSTAATGTYDAVVVAMDGEKSSLHGAFCVHP